MSPGRESHDFIRATMMHCRGKTRVVNLNSGSRFPALANQRPRVLPQLCFAHRVTLRSRFDRRRLGKDVFAAVTLEPVARVILTHAF